MVTQIVVETKKYLYLYKKYLIVLNAICLTLRCCDRRVPTREVYRHSELVLACGLWLASVATVAVPFVGQLALLATMFALSGVADGIINSGRCQAPAMQGGWLHRMSISVYLRF